MSILLYILTLVFMNLIVFFIMKSTNKNKKHVYINAFCVYNDRVYWLKGEELISADYSNKEIDILSGVPVDQLNDLMPVEVIAIIEHLEERQ